MDYKMDQKSVVNFRLFLRSRLLWISSIIILSSLFAFFSWIAFPRETGIVFPCLLLSVLLAILIPALCDYLHKRRFYLQLSRITEQMRDFDWIENSQLAGHSPEEKIIFEKIYEISMSQQKLLDTFKNTNENYEEYIELWVHEIKTPLVLLSLTLDNYKEKLPATVGHNLQIILEKMEEQVQQVLYYARSQAISKDFHLVEISLDTLCKSVVRQKAEQLLVAHARIDMQDMPEIVLVDVKNFAFVLSQLIDNSIKYAVDEPCFLHFSSQTDKNEIHLCIEDNGIGIKPEELPFIFDKGFTGSNGRLNTKSTGMGLYICKNLCDKMGICMTCQSETGTCFSFTFPFIKRKEIDG